jgi:hypothetical protein
MANRSQVDQEHAARYARDFLPRLRALPSAAPPAQRGANASGKGLNSRPAPKKRVMLDAETGRLAVVDLDDPTTWCAHCREEARRIAVAR